MSQLDELVPTRMQDLAADVLMLVQSRGADAVFVLRFKDTPDALVIATVGTCDESMRAAIQAAFSNVVAREELSNVARA